MYNGIIVDDAMIMRLRLADILEKEFKIVTTASTGQEGLDMYAYFKPDFITFDISMPEKDGIQALRELLIRFPDAKVIIVSAVGQKQIVFEALALGAKDFIIKPFDAERVLKSVKRLFEDDDAVGNDGNIYGIAARNGDKSVLNADVALHGATSASMAG